MTTDIRNETTNATDNTLISKGDDVIINAEDEATDPDKPVSGEAIQELTPATESEPVIEDQVIIGTGGDDILEGGEGAHKAACPAPAIGAMAIGHRFRRPHAQCNSAAIAAAGHRVWRQPGAPRALRGCNGGAGSRFPSSGSASRTGSLRRPLAYAGRRRRGQSRGR